MFEIGAKVQVRFRGEAYLGTVRSLKWGLAFLDFEGKRENGWIGINRLEKANAVHDTNRSAT